MRKWGREEEKRDVGKWEWRPRGRKALSSLCLIIFYAEAAASGCFWCTLFCRLLAFIYRVQRCSDGRETRGETGVKSTLTADWNVDGNFKSLGWKWYQSVASTSSVRKYLRIFASMYLRIYGVIKNVSLYLSVGPKLFVTLYASLNSCWGGWCFWWTCVCVCVCGYPGLVLVLGLWAFFCLGAITTF